MVLWWILSKSVRRTCTGLKWLRIWTRCGFIRKRQRTFYKMRVISWSLDEIRAAELGLGSKELAIHLFRQVFCLYFYVKADCGYFRADRPAYRFLLFTAPCLCLLGLHYRNGFDYSNNVCYNYFYHTSCAHATLQGIKNKMLPTCL
jgi:hypothetical protein